jgi:hypothetical protein
MRILKVAMAGAAVCAASPAFADAPGGVSGGVVDACSAVYVQGAIACQGYYGGNLFSGAAGTATSADIQTAIFALLNGTASTLDSSPTNNTGLYTPPYLLDYSQVLAAITSSSGNVSGVPYDYVFSGPALSGLTVFGAHFGNQPDAGTENNISAFWLVDLGSTPTHTVTISNGLGVSNAQIFATSGAVPEPATWAMMLLGFAGIGASMRRGRPVPLAQLA